MGWLTRFRIHQLKKAMRINAERGMLAYLNNDTALLKKLDAQYTFYRNRIDALTDKDK